MIEPAPAPITPRLPDWEDRLFAVIAAAHAHPLAWGRLDCLIFAGQVVEALTGADHYSASVGRYRSRAGAFRHLKAMGFATPADLLSGLFPPIAPAMARRGDLALVDGCAGVVAGPVALFLPEENEAPGLVRVPLPQWQQCWQVG